MNLKGMRYGTWEGPNQDEWDERMTRMLIQDTFSIHLSCESFHPVYPGSDNCTFSITNNQ